jgi:hypothetical protein
MEIHSSASGKATYPSGLFFFVLAACLGVVLSLMTFLFFLVFLPTYVLAASTDYYLLERLVECIRADRLQRIVVRISLLTLGIAGLSVVCAWVQSSLGVFPGDANIAPFLTYVFFLATAVFSVLNFSWVFLIRHQAD